MIYFFENLEYIRYERIYYFKILLIFIMENNNKEKGEKDNDQKQNEKENEETFLKLKKMFDDNKIEYTLLVHGGNAKTSEEVAKIRGTPLETGAKSMIIKIDTGFIDIVIPADKKFNSRPAKKFLKTDCLRFGKPEELSELTHCIQGSVPPFGSLFGLKTYVDENLIKNKSYDYIVFNGGLRTKSFKIKKEDYLKLENPTICNICK